jgi:hypothetical protein
MNGKIGWETRGSVQHIYRSGHQYNSVRHAPVRGPYPYDGRCARGSSSYAYRQPPTTKAEDPGSLSAPFQVPHIGFSSGTWGNSHAACGFGCEVWRAPGDCSQMRRWGSVGWSISGYLPRVRIRGSWLKGMTRVWLTDMLISFDVPWWADRVLTFHPLLSLGCRPM